MGPLECTEKMGSSMESLARMRVLQSQVETEVLHI